MPRLESFCLLYYTTLCYAIFSCAVIHYTILCCAVLYCAIFDLTRFNPTTPRPTMLYSTRLASTCSTPSDHITSYPTGHASSTIHSPCRDPIQPDPLGWSMSNKETKQTTLDSAILVRPGLTPLHSTRLDSAPLDPTLDSVALALCFHQTRSLTNLLLHRYHRIAMPHHLYTTIYPPPPAAPMLLVPCANTYARQHSTDPAFCTLRASPEFCSFRRQSISAGIFRQWCFQRALPSA